MGIFENIGREALIGGCVGVVGLTLVIFFRWLNSSPLSRKWVLPRWFERWALLPLILGIFGTFFLYMISTQG